MNFWRAACSGALLLCVALLRAEDAPAELDIVVTAKTMPTTIPKEHGENLLKVLQKDMRETFFRLVSPNAPTRTDVPPTDGAAKHRLFVDYSSTINCGAAISMKMMKDTNVGGDYTIRRWYLPFDQKAAVSVRLARWNGGTYEDVAKFSAPVPKSEKEQRDGAALQVAELHHRAGSPDAGNQCPVTVEEARKIALRNALPPSLRSTLYSRLVPITLLKATPTKMEGGKPAQVAVELKIENKTAWPLRRAEFVFAQGGANFICGDERGMPGNTAFALPEVLAPGKTVTVKTIARPHQGGLPPGTQNAEFATGAGGP